MTVSRVTGAVLWAADFGPKPLTLLRLEAVLAGEAVFGPKPLATLCWEGLANAGRSPGVGDFAR